MAFMGCAADKDKCFFRSGKYPFVGIVVWRAGNFMEFLFFSDSANGWLDCL